MGTAHGYLRVHRNGDIRKDLLLKEKNEFTTEEFLHVQTLGWKGFPVTYTLAYWEHT